MGDSGGCIPGGAVSDRTSDPRYRGDHPMFKSCDTCDRCHRDMGPKEYLNEAGTMYICDECFERLKDEE